MSVHPYVCLNCGNKIDTLDRFFSIDKILKYYKINGEDADKTLKEYIDIGVNYGTSVLNADIPVITTKEPRIPEESLGKIQLTVDNLITSIEQQFGLNGAILTFFRALEERNIDGSSIDLPLVEQLYQQGIVMYRDIENTLGHWIKQEGNLSRDDVRKERILCFVRVLYDLWQEEKTRPSTEIYGAWVQEENNGKLIPRELYLCGHTVAGTGNMEYVSEMTCCCPKCHQPISKYFGIYEQKIIGMLGGTSTGKTTYMAALADYIDSSFTFSGELPFKITYKPSGDVQWDRFLKIGDGNGWRYKHGWRAKETDRNKDASVALTYFVTPKDKEPILYVVADIAGENSNATNLQYAVETSNTLTGYCDALFMVMSCDKEDAKITAAHFNETVSQITYGRKNIRGALLLSKFDKIIDSEGKFIYGYEPVVTSSYPLESEKKSLVYNVEPMSSLCRYTGEYAKKLVPGIVDNLINKFDAFAVFPLNSGTGGYKDKGNHPSPEEENEAERQYQLAKSTRYGVFAPFFWLMAVEGILPVGTADRSLEEQEDARMNELLHDELSPHK